MTPDELVQQIFATQLEINSDADPGDLTIIIQDDLPMVEVRQPRHLESYETPADWLDALMKGYTQGVFGPTVQETLENYLKEVQDGNR